MTSERHNLFRWFSPVPQSYTRLHTCCKNCSQIVDTLIKFCNGQSEREIFYLEFNDFFTEQETRHLCSHLSVECTPAMKLQLIGGTCQAKVYFNNYTEYPTTTQHEAGLGLDFSKKSVHKVPSHVAGLIIFPGHKELDLDIRLRSDIHHESGLAKLINYEYAPSRQEYDTKQLCDWFSDCVKSHHKCEEFRNRIQHAQRRPTRILRIHSHEVTLQCNPEQLGRYAYGTLSHIWGNDPSQQFILTKRDIQKLQAGIPISKLPVIFREAIRLARLLDLKFLWIDSMCIIQDCKSDWEHEAPLMASVYGNAACNFACTLPPAACRHGISSSREDPRLSLPCFLGTYTIAKETKYMFAHHDLRRAIDPWNGRISSDGWADASTWPLNSRAWVYQEHFLSTRTVFFGQKRLLWDCCHGLQDERVGKLRPYHSHKEEIFESCCRYIFVDNDSSGGSLRKIAETWAKIINEYRSRQLTKPTDRVIAFAGIAQAVHNITKLTYVAGLWFELFPLQLLWYQNSTKQMLQRPSYSVPGAPTWSVFAVPISPGIKSKFKVSRVLQYDRENTPLRYLASILSFRWPSHPEGQVPQDSYTNFTGLRLKIKSRMFSTECIYERMRLRSGWYVCGGDLFNHLNSLICFTDCYIKVYFDDVTMNHDTLPESIVMAPFLELRYFHPEKHVHDLYGLVIQYDEARDAWMRIGMWRICGGFHDFQEPGHLEELFVLSGFRNVEGEVYTLI